jgi:hypothetical protein
MRHPLLDKWDEVVPLEAPAPGVLVGMDRSKAMLADPVADRGSLAAKALPDLLE